VVTALHWYTNNNKCILTEIYNELCNLDGSTPFNDVFDIIGLKQYDWWNTKGHYIYLLFGFSIATIKLFM
jgi:hypothetical protein